MSNAWITPGSGLRYRNGLPGRLSLLALAPFFDRMADTWVAPGSAASYPYSLPAPMVSGYGVEPVDPVIRTDMDAGSTRSRRRFTTTPDIIAVTWRFTDTEKSLFRDWHSRPDGANGGAAWFNLPLAQGFGGIQTVTAKFKTMWKSKLLPGLNWELSASLEVRND